MTHIDRRDFLGELAAGTSAWAAASGAAPPLGTASGGPGRLGASPPRKSPSRMQSELREPALRPLPLGSIRPRGWLARQLRIQADGLSGHLDEFWPDIGSSRWFGGDAEGWERAPYWLDGVIPLAWILGDTSLQEKVAGYVGTIVRNQRSDGWYGPYPTDAAAGAYDLWAILLANKMMVQYHDALWIHPSPIVLASPSHSSRLADVPWMQRASRPDCSSQSEDRVLALVPVRQQPSLIKLCTVLRAVHSFVRLLQVRSHPLEV